MKFAKTLLALLPALAAAQSSDFRDYINGLAQQSPSSPTDHESWALFLGMTQTPDNTSGYLQLEIDAGRWINPFTRRSLDDAPVFAFGQDNNPLEYLRVILDHLDIRPLDNPNRPLGTTHYDIDNLICHSNGCTGAIHAIEQGDINVKHLFAMGTDWTTESLDPLRMHGTDVTFFVTKTDPVPKIPGLSLQHASDHALGSGVTIHFSDLADAVRQLGNFATGQQPDSTRYAMVVMDARPGRTGLAAHSLTESYFPSVGNWLTTKGDLQSQFRMMFNPVPPPTRPNPPPAPAATKVGSDPRGGVFADIPISASDVRKGAKK